jgi:hypothetical protein
MAHAYEKGVHMLRSSETRWCGAQVTIAELRMADLPLVAIFFGS